ncbi:SPOR domain-containing protein [Algoriphagus kandeliae]|uniref:SPOR domain-containing protein n=1 Tax=Algoriphagus kandeliae TaxID=2562278 RepID=A0A4Y9QZ54_9BACT|nr:SPOR domain-containing protein [Algoriphagus kandeliae]TFV97841.1 SPOR domain-containing protein [Algoriphagus kandeliae]
MEKKVSKTWNDPKDFGLPFVEVKTLKEQQKLPQKAVKVDADSAQEKPMEAAELRKKIRSQIPVKPVEPSEISPKEEVTVKPEQSVQSYENKKEVVQKAEDRVIPKKKTPSWVIYVLFIGLLLVSAVVWQLMKEKDSAPVTTEQINMEQEPIAQVEQEVVQEPENIQEEIPQQVSENQQTEEETPRAQNPNPPAAETGTTIERSVERSLIRIESREDRSRYFIVVGSLPSERLAVAKSEEYWDRASELYLITPYEDSPNYRLAIGRYYSFSQANQALSEIKDDYSEALWILKY